MAYSPETPCIAPLAALECVKSGQAVLRNIRQVTVGPLGGSVVTAGDTLLLASFADCQCIVC